MVISVGLATIAAAIGAGGLGELIFSVRHGEQWRDSRRRSSSCAHGFDRRRSFGMARNASLRNGWRRMTGQARAGSEGDFQSCRLAGLELVSARLAAPFPCAISLPY